jgi:flavorubredoxin
MKPRKIKENIYSVGAVDWDRRLFDQLIPLPDGTSYNSYLVTGGEKNALIDTVDPPMEHVLRANLRELGDPRIDYVVCQHAEQDHSGSIPAVLEWYPDAKVVTNPRCMGLLIDLLHIPEERFITVEDGEELALGGKTLKFIYAPWVHWPETMLTYLGEERVLFSCDFLGSHLATSEAFVTDESATYEAAKRYYAEIMMPFRAQIAKHLDTVAGLAIDLIAPSHGPAYDRPAFILDAYCDWATGAPKNLVVVAYVSMHDSTRLMVEHFVRALGGLGVQVMQFDLAHADIGKLAMSLVDAATVIIGTPTVLGGPHPQAAYAAFLVNALKPKAKWATVIGSFGWGGRTVEKLQGMLGSVDAEFLEPVLVKGLPREADYGALDTLAQTVYDKHCALKACRVPER